jgi:thioredoxin-like negative regulator of GroEL
VAFPVAPTLKPTGFDVGHAGHPREVSPQDEQPRGELPTLLFFRRERCGLSRRMESLVAWVKVTRKRDLRVVDVDVERSPALVDRLRVGQIPTLVLVKNKRVVGKLEGRATGRQIDALIGPHVG